MVRMEGDVLVHEVVWQAKFTNRLDATTKRSVRESIAAITERADVVVRKWVLCLPIDPTGVFLDWLAKELPSAWTHEVWGATILLEKLEANPAITEAFFYGAYEELRQYFAVEKLELVRLVLDPSCQWLHSDSKVLHFHSKNVESPDLVFDVIVRNAGRVDAVLLALEVQFIDWEPTRTDCRERVSCFRRSHTRYPSTMGAPVAIDRFATHRSWSRLAELSASRFVSAIPATLGKERSP